ncbi:uncharacterized protein EHS24_007014 [Apiotrichum porosum]|uniref:Expansin-like EG45 domain-containing protein n=1 Tax=Apiotrichum porosum TaxID=105984 RepID=A0A427XWQ8_9TREE|nr:uncharacterized protein EHS24_007014 [Apiotrichum porosum]RSH83336.1 hypothetical protein EHS24_007014 [Apiotrichum porosum]
MKLAAALLLAVPAIAGRCGTQAAHSAHASYVAQSVQSAQAAQSATSAAVEVPAASSAAVESVVSADSTVVAVPVTVAASSAAEVTESAAATDSAVDPVVESASATAEAAATSSVAAYNNWASAQASSSSSAAQAQATSVSTTQAAEATSEATTQAQAQVSSESTAQASTTASSAAAASTSSIWDYLSTVSYSGTSTFYGGNLNGGACSFTTLSTLPSGIYGTAYSGAVWDNAAECGACIEVTGPTGATIKAMVVDECPECEQGHLDLFPDAFTAVGGTDGTVTTSYRFVECGLTSPITLHNKEGTSQYWFAMQVVNANEPVSTLEVSVDGGSTWTAATRTTYNYFEYSAGFGSASMDIRVTSITGATITYEGATPDAEAQFTASSNF